MPDGYYDYPTPGYTYDPDSLHPLPSAGGSNTYYENEERREWISQGGATASGHLDVGLPATVALQGYGTSGGLPWAPPSAIGAPATYPPADDAPPPPPQPPGSGVAPGLAQIGQAGPVGPHTIGGPPAPTGGIGPGGGVFAGMREAFGAHVPEQLMTPTERATGFNPRWGLPPALDGLVWNAARFVYDPFRLGLGDNRYRELKGLADTGVFIQPYRDELAAPGRWLTRWVQVSTEYPDLASPYEVIGPTDELAMTGAAREAEALEEYHDRPLTAAEEYARKVKLGEAVSRAGPTDWAREQVAQKEAARPISLNDYRWVLSTDLPPTCTYPHPYMPVPRQDYDSGWWLSPDYVPSIPLPWPYNEIPWQCKLTQGATDDRGKGGGQPGPGEPRHPGGGGPRQPVDLSDEMGLHKLVEEQGPTIGKQAGQLLAAKQAEKEEKEDPDGFDPATRHAVENDPAVQKARKKADKDAAALSAAKDKYEHAAQHGTEWQKKVAKTALNSAQAKLDRSASSARSAELKAAKRFNQGRADQLARESRKLTYKARMTGNKVTRKRLEKERDTKSEQLRWVGNLLGQIDQRQAAQDRLEKTARPSAARAGERGAESVGVARDDEAERRKAGELPPTGPTALADMTTEELAAEEVRLKKHLGADVEGREAADEALSRLERVRGELARRGRADRYGGGAVSQTLPPGGGVNYAPEPRGGPIVNPQGQRGITRLEMRRLADELKVFMDERRKFARLRKDLADELIKPAARRNTQKLERLLRELVAQAKKMEQEWRKLNKSWIGQPGGRKGYAEVSTDKIQVGGKWHDIRLIVQKNGMFEKGYEGWRRVANNYPATAYPDGTRPLGVVFGKLSQDPHGEALVQFVEDRLAALAERLRAEVGANPTARQEKVNRIKVLLRHRELQRITRHFPEFAAVAQGVSVEDGRSADGTEHGTKTIRFRMRPVQDEQDEGSLRVGKSADTMHRDILVQLNSGPKSSLEDVEDSSIPWHVFRGDGRPDTADYRLGGATDEDPIAAKGRGGAVRRLLKALGPRGTQKAAGVLVSEGMERR